MLIKPTTLLQNIPKVAPKYAKALEKLGLLTVSDLLLYFPFRYDDFSTVAAIDENILDQTVTVVGTITKTKLTRIFRRKLTIAEIIIQDENNVPLKAVWFNQPFVLESLKEGLSVRLSGKVTLDKKFLAMSNPAWERSARDTTNTGRLVPVYNETKGITSKWIRWQIKPLLPIAQEMADMLPPETRERLHLYDLETSLREIHFPEDPEKLSRAQKRFAFQEMFLVQLKALQIKNEWDRNSAQTIIFDKELIKKFTQNLPFQLTDAQRKAAFEILKDLEKPRPMNRLLNGDVGSGKTIVAAIATLQAISADYQVAIMAPTEVLAKQHFEGLCRLFAGYNFNIALFTNSYKEIFSNTKEKSDRESLLGKIGNGKINLAIGTHALIQKDVHFKKLALLIIDEQHRFGVAQRAYLQQETLAAQDGLQKSIPHLLTMTATPIPRTLSIAIAGSLNISILDEMPKNRKPIITKIIPPRGRALAYDFIRSEIKNGRQVFIILPLVEESKVLTEVKAAVAEHKRLTEEIFPDLKIGLLHGKMPARNKSATSDKITKEQVMDDFKNKKYDILVSTSVIEVGIDIPNASVILIEDADRFGLSQLHQFRGRVGRGEHQSYCLLFTSSDTEKTLERLTALVDNNDGFAIAQKDLELRGPGQFFGTIQSGLPDIAMEHLANVKLIKFSQAEAQAVLQNDPGLKNHPALRQALKKFEEKIHLE
jgi:ATP-dependent DNA helicase RecG